MAHAHSHHKHGETHSHRHGVHEGTPTRALLLALIITVSVAVIELGGGLLSGSLALLADAGHMATDVLALALSLSAAWLARQRTGRQRTFGYYRAEILAALVNGAALLLIAAGIAWQAVGRLRDPSQVAAEVLLPVALLGLLANLAAGGLLLRAGGDGLNVRGALLHVAGDTLGSVGALLAGALIVLTGWQQADPLVSVLIAVLIVFSSWRLISEAVDVLLEAAPRGIDVREMERAIRETPGVQNVHDVHVWTVTSGFVSMSGHVELDGTRESHGVLDAVTRLMCERFAVDHVTIQPESVDHAADCCDVGCEQPVSALRADDGLATRSRR